MSHPAALTRLSVAAIFADGQKIVQRIKKSKGRERLSLWLVIQKLIWTLRKWRLPDFIDSSFVKSGSDLHSKELARYSDGERQCCYKSWGVWEICVQDISHHGRSVKEYPLVVTVHFKDSSEFRRFKAFLRHLVSNWLDEIKVQKLYANNTGFLVTCPAPALLFFFPNTSIVSTNSPDLTKPEVSNAMTVIKALKKVMSEDFHLEILSEEALQIKSKSSGETSKLRVSKKEKWDMSEEVIVPTKEESEFIWTEIFVCGDEITAELLKHQEHGYLTVPQCVDQSTQTKEHVETKGTQTSLNSDEWKFKNDKLMETIRSLEFEMTRKEADYKKAVFDLEKTNRELKDQLVRVRNRLEANEEELRETFLELGRASVEVTRMKNEKKREFEFDKTFKSINVTTQTSQPLSSAQAPTSGIEEVAVKSNTQFQSHFGDTGENSENFSPEVSVQESMEVSSSAEGASLTNMPTTAVERSLYNNYKLLLLTIADRLLSSDVARLKTWASSMFSADVSLDISEVFHDLDRKKVISASDLSKLREFFETIVRIDLVHLIDCFLLGDYTPLRSTNSTRILRIENRRTNRSASSAAAQGIFSNSSTRLQSSISSERQSSQTFPSKQPQFDENKKSVTGYRPRLSQAPLKTASLFANSETENATQDTRQTTRGLIITDGSVSGDNGASDEVDSSSRNANGSSTEPADGAAPSDTRFQGRMGSNGNKLSKFQRADSDEEDSDDEQWLCSHYKRRCYVKFNCCNRYWPCHRCHNNESKCGKKKLKSRDTEFIKCVKCGTEQKFTSRSQFCTKCHRKFAKYFCPICKHLTGTDDNPYHCQKCGICRIHKDRSFHCDVCGVCLDVQLRGNHKCRAGSAHDECCICLEDAFTGCQILPCSHKVHKECATQMIRSGITRCPICRESFAHKLERRTSPRSKKPPGK